MTVPTAEYLGLLAWAVGASLVAADRMWMCRRWHRDLTASDFIAWDGQPPATTPETADAGREQEKAAS